MQQCRPDARMSSWHAHEGPTVKFLTCPGRLLTMRYGEWRNYSTVSPIETGRQSVNTLAYSPNGSKIATGGFYGVKIWDNRQYYWICSYRVEPSFQRWETGDPTTCGVLRENTGDDSRLQWMKLRWGLVKFIAISAERTVYYYLCRYIQYWNSSNLSWTDYGRMKIVVPFASVLWNSSIMAAIMEVSRTSSESQPLNYKWISH